MTVAAEGILKVISHILSIEYEAAFERTYALTIYYTVLGVHGDHSVIVVTGSL